MGISPLYSIHQYSEEIYKVVAFKGVRDPENPRVRDKEQEQHYDAKLNETFCRANSLVLQYALCNPWDFFFTGTDNFTSARYVTVHRAFPAGTLKTHFQKMLSCSQNGSISEGRKSVSGSRGFGGSSGVSFIASTPSHW